MTSPLATTIVRLIVGVRRRLAAAKGSDRTGGDQPPAVADILLTEDAPVFLGPSAIDLVPAFERLAGSNLYVYLDLDERRLVLSYSIADAGFVRDVAVGASGHYVELMDQPALAFVPFGPDSEAQMSQILGAWKASKPVALRNASICGTVVAVAVVAPTTDMLRERLAIATDVDVSSLTAVDYAEAVRCFDILTTLTCPMASSDVCVATYYIRKGCQARAHRFCTHLAGLETPVVAAKKWAWARSLLVEPPHMPCCRIHFSVHVSLALAASDRAGHYVLDHALFTAPVSEDEWLAKLESANRLSEISPAGVYKWDGPKHSGIKEIEGDTEAGLKSGRIMQALMIDQHGQPPYQTCCIKIHGATSEFLDPLAYSAEAE